MYISNISRVPIRCSEKVNDLNKNMNSLIHSLYSDFVRNFRIVLLAGTKWGHVGVAC